MKYIKKFENNMWLPGGNLYVQNKFNKDSLQTLVNMNSQNGYAESGQWVLTQNGKVLIDEMGESEYTGHDEDGNEVSGSLSDIIRTLSKEEVIKESNSITDLEEIGEGTEGIIYSDGEYAYKVAPVNVQGTPNDILKRSKYNHPNIVKVYDAFLLPEDNDFVVTKMELLENIEENIDLNDEEVYDEYYHIMGVLYNECDNNDIGGSKNLLKLNSPNHEIQKMLDAIKSAYKEIGHIDVGFHNLMYDKKTKQYKQIDI